MFYFYDQNNSGGFFIEDENLAKMVVVEADDYEEANVRAEDLGMYFDGDGDCPCCGNRWYQMWEDDGYEGTVYMGDDLLTENEQWTQVKPEGRRDPYLVVHMKDGRVIPVYFRD